MPTECSTPLERRDRLQEEHAKLNSVIAELRQERPDRVMKVTLVDGSSFRMTRAEFRRLMESSPWETRVAERPGFGVSNVYINPANVCWAVEVDA